MKRNDKLVIPAGKVPKVLFLGNGIIQLAGGGDWDRLLGALNDKSIPKEVLEGVPFSMRPEIMYGIDAEDVQRKTAEALDGVAPAIHPLLRKLLELPFDAILTTNYTYEIEVALSAKSWNKARRSNAFCALHGSGNVRDNTCICNLVQTADGREIPVFHIHGEQQRKHSMILSYYSYAKSIAKLYEVNKARGKQYMENEAEAQPTEVWSWLDYFILGDVFSVGFGFDLSEFDIWWALERKAREKATHGKMYMYMTPKAGEVLKQAILAEAMGAELYRRDVSRQYEPVYEQIYNEICETVLNDDKTTNSI